MPKISLNPQQQKAITHQKGPLLIIAGAGTGKTTVITEKIKHLIKSKKLDSQSILALTFTDKAATEMLDRLDLVMPLGYQQPWLSTFHSFCDRLLKTEGLEIGLDPGYKILPSAQQWILIKKHLFDFKLSHYRPLGNPTKFISALLTFFSRAQDEDANPDELIKFAKKQKAQSSNKEAKEAATKLFEVAKAYQTYQALKAKHSFLDFGDLITHTLKLFRTRPSILKKYQDQFQHLLIDEFQDTNYAQFQLIKLLAPAKNKPNLTVVGDDDQSIYKFRGAAISNILEFKNDYPKSKEIVLTQNYRSTKPILDSAYKLIQHNNPDRLESKLKINKKLASNHPKSIKAKPQIIKLPTVEDETQWITQKILELTAKKNYTFKDFAILTRANSQLEPFVTAFKNHGLPYQLIGNRGLFDQEEIRQLICFLHTLVNPNESINLFQFLHHPSFNISPSEIFTLIQKAKAKRIPLYEVLKDQTQEQFTFPISIIATAQDQALNDPPTKIIHQFIKTTNYLKHLLKTETVASHLKIKNINLFLQLIQRYETDTQSATVIDLVDYLDLLLEAGDNPAQAEIEDIDTIRLITIHSAKGLEFPVVFMPSLVSGRFPAINRRDPIEFPDKLIKEQLPQGNQNIQEERRLFYVGLTRAQDHLFLTCAGDYGGLRQRHPSGFLNETKLPHQEISQPPQLSLLDVPESSQPKVVKISDSKPSIQFVSYSQIDTFKTCPLKYKYRYLLQVPSAPHHALSFGQSIHDTLRHFHTFELKGQKPTLKDLLYLYKQYFREAGYDSQDHKQKRFSSGKKALKKYYKVYRQKLGQPIQLEKSFRITISGIPLVGKIDRIDKVGDSYEIVDYKTGSSKDKKQVDKDEQLSIYALGAKHALSLPIKTLSLYFLETNEKVSTTRSETELKATFTRLKERINQMQTSKFSAKPGYPFPCSYCDYKSICPFAAKKR